jgi:hypothetical protein
MQNSWAKLNPRREEENMTELLRVWRRLLAIIALCGAAAGGYAQTYPAKTARLIAPFPPCELTASGWPLPRSPSHISRFLHAQKL